MIILALALIGSAIASIFVTGSQIHSALGSLSLLAAANALFNVGYLVKDFSGENILDYAAVGFYLLIIAGLGLLIFGILVWVLKRSDKTPVEPSFQCSNH